MEHSKGIDKLPSMEELEPCVAAILEATSASQNEEQLKIEIEGILKSICKQQGIFWNPYTYEKSFRSGRHRLDVVHGSTIIEYESPKSFRRIVGARLRRARKQAEDYCSLLAAEEGRRDGAYTLVAWDGETISFGHVREGEFSWDDPSVLNSCLLYRLLMFIERGGKPLVSPMVLKQFIGPDTAVGGQVIAALYNAVVAAVTDSNSTRTKLMYTEWARLFGQVDGISSEKLQSYLADASTMHSTNYLDHPQAYIFALNTYIAIVAKVCAVHALMDGEDELFPTTSAIEFLRDVESDRLFRLKGIQNMLTTDFFSWYLGEDVAETVQESLQVLLSELAAMDFDVTRKSSESVRDLFKGLYMEFTPAPMRHALGEYYTPDWLASHVVDEAGWTIDDSLLDPTCGSGTFLLEAVKRRLECAHPDNTAKEILEGLHGFDLNPLAVLTARASLVVFLSGHFSPSEKTLLPVFLADAINTADPRDGVFTHSILTEKGKKTFAIPHQLAVAPDFYDVMDRLRVCIDANMDAERIKGVLKEASVTVRFLNEGELSVFFNTINDLVELHRNHWNGIWCFILFDRIKAGCILNVDYVIGNPPWVKWSELPRPYAEFIKPLCERMDIFSEDAWVGGIQSDVSTVVTYHALERFVRKGGTLAFLITGTVFKNESSQGFRRWTLHMPDGTLEHMSVQGVEDYREIRPFKEEKNWPALLLVRRDGNKTSYPVPYRIYRKPQGKKIGAGLLANPEDCKATPVPGSDGGPWLVGPESKLPIWSRLLDASRNGSSYTARKGITTDANGIFFVNAATTQAPGKLRITNDPSNGRRNVARITVDVEANHIYPLLRGRDVTRFHANPSSGSYVIVPQSGMNGDESLPAKSPELFGYLSRFKDTLGKRSSYRRFQRGKPFWSIWTVGLYTFAPYKVVWKEMSGSNFVAAYVGSGTLPDGSPKIIVPDHKVYFIPVETEDEAAYLTAYLNARTVSGAVGAYASALSLGTSVSDYLKIPSFDSENPHMVELSILGKKLSRVCDVSIEDEVRLDELAKEVANVIADDD